MCSKAIHDHHNDLDYFFFPSDVLQLDCSLFWFDVILRDVLFSKFMGFHVIFSKSMFLSCSDAMWYDVLLHQIFFD